MKLRRDPPEGHQPDVTRVSTVTVICQRTGPEFAIEEYNTARYHTLADVEAWTARLRQLGAADDLVLKDADGLTATMNATS